MRIFAENLAMLNKAIIAGASGLIGSNLLQILLNQSSYDEILVLVRKEIAVKHPKLVQLIINFDQLEQYEASITGHAIFCCLGTTKSKTPDTGVYRKIDHDYPIKLAQLGVKNRVNHYHFVSSLGANSRSSNFYLKTKGETEEALQQCLISNLQIYQPSLLTGDRQEFRFGERIATIFMKVLDNLLIGKLNRYRSIPAGTVAMAMYKQSLKNEEGIFIHPSDKIKQLA